MVRVRLAINSSLSVSGGGDGDLPFADKRYQSTNSEILALPFLGLFSVDFPSRAFCVQVATTLHYYHHSRRLGTINLIGIMPQHRLKALSLRPPTTTKTPRFGT